jgi:hypothetical protein
MVETMELPRISIQTEVKKVEPRPFVGRVVADVIGPNKFYDPNAEDQKSQKPFQWSIAVEPLKSKDGTKGFQIGGKTNAFWEYVSISADEVSGDIKEQSKFGRHFRAFRDVFGTDQDRSIGRGEYLDEVAWFKRDTIEYGINRQTNEPIKGTVTLPIAPLTEEELIEYGLAVGGPIERGDGGGYEQDELEKLAAALDGRDRTSFQKAVYANKLGNKLAQGVAKGNGPAVVRLILDGYGTFDGDVFRKAA